MDDLAALPPSPASWSHLCTVARAEPARLDAVRAAAGDWDDGLRVLPWDWREPLLAGEPLPAGLVRVAALSRLKLGVETAALLSGPVLGAATRWDLSDNRLGTEGAAALGGLGELEQVT